MEDTRTFVLSGRRITQAWDGLCWTTVSDEPTAPGCENRRHGICDRPATVVATYPGGQRFVMCATHGAALPAIVTVHPLPSH